MGLSALKRALDADHVLEDMGGQEEGGKNLAVLDEQAALF